MKHPLILWLALLFSLLTATSHATHLKGGTLSWEPVSSSGSTFTVKAKIQLNYDISETSITGATGPMVKGKRVYQENDIVAVNVGQTTLYWGDEAPNSGGIDLEGSESSFRVVKIDEAAQIITVEPEPTDPGVLEHSYTGSEGGLFTMNLRANSRDGEEVTNRPGDMRLESIVKLAAPLSNRPPAFKFNDADTPIPLPVVVTRSGTASFDVPVAKDPDNATTPTDTITYRFVDAESEATQGSTEEFPWEKRGAIHPSIAYDSAAGKWKISWDTSAIDQTIHTHAFQVVAEDRPVGDPTGPAKSKATIEFQVWVNNPAQDGVPGISLAPDFTTFTGVAGTPVEFRIVGTDRNSEGKLENSRLHVTVGTGEMPTGAVITPAGGFVGESNHHDVDDHMEGVFSWTPLPADVGSTKILNFRVVDEDGHQSPVKTVTINVVPGNGPQPLELTVTPSTVEGDHLRVTVPPNEPMSLAVAATCATSGVPLQLYTEHELPGNAVMTPPLPLSGISNAQSTFSWTPGTSDITPVAKPHEVIFIAGDAHGREVIKKVLIYVLPPVPTITLAPGEPTSVATGPWQTVRFDVIAAGGYGTSTTLTLTVPSPGTGSLNRHSVNSGERSTFTWRVLPGQATSGVLRVEVKDTLGQMAFLEVPYTLTYPAPQDAAPEWWTQHNVVTGGTAQNFGMANQGQLKTITKAAYDALKADYPNLDAIPVGESLKTFVDGFSTTSTDYSPATQGQVKHAASLVYAVIGAVINKGTLGLPWTGVITDDQSYAPANVGQIKTLFSFPMPSAGLFNDPPVVTITSPASGATFHTRNTVTITADATDADGSIASVAFYANGSLLTTDTSSPYAYPWTGMDPGAYVIEAEATDNTGATHQRSIPITVNQWVNTLPSVAITNVTNGQDFPSPAYFTVEAVASDVDGPIESVSFYCDGELLGVVTTSPYSASLKRMLVGRDDHELKAVAKDIDGGLKEQIISFDVTVPSTAGTATSIVLQHGEKGYEGVTDTYINENSPTLEKDDDLFMQADNDPDMAALIKWDLSLIPSNAIVTNVTLGLRTAAGTPSSSSTNFEIYPLNRTWDPANTNWEYATASDKWGVSNSNPTGGVKTATDYENLVLGRYEGQYSNAFFDAVNNGTNMKTKVQAWVGGTATNNGFLIRDYGAADGGAGTLRVYSSEYTLISYRPKLTIYYYIPLP